MFRLVSYDNRLFRYSTHFTNLNFVPIELQSAQRRIRAMILSTNPPPAPKRTQRPPKDSSPSGSAGQQQQQHQQAPPSSSQ